MASWDGDTGITNATTSSWTSILVVVELGRRLGRSDPESIEAALTFLERDPFFFRSGYARERVARALAHAELTPTQKVRARTLLLSTVDGQRHCPLPGAGKLARAVADNSPRRELRESKENVARLQARVDAHRV